MNRGDAVESRRTTVRDVRRANRASLLTDLFHGGLQSRQELAASTALSQASFEAEVQPPYGADHVVVIAARDDPVELRAAIAAAEGQRATSDVTAAIVRAVKAHRMRLGLDRTDDRYRANRRAPGISRPGHRPGGR